MRTFIVLWFGPLFLLGAWYGLSVNDWHMGMAFFSRETHDKVFQVYSAMTGIAPDVLPGLILKAVLVDNLFVVAFIAFRKRALWLPKALEMGRSIIASAQLYLFQSREPIKASLQND